MKTKCKLNRSFLLALSLSLSLLLSCSQRPSPISYQEVDSKLQSAKTTGALIFIYSTDCKLCLEQIPVVNKIKDSLKQNGFEVLAVSIDDIEDKFSTYLNKNKVSFKPLILKNKAVGGLTSLLARYSGLYKNSVPYSAVMNRSGKIIKEWTGHASFEEYVHWIQKAAN
ncbi:MAG: redoxin protein [uncultured bacterium]|nr:MAG: redoxin protein [uncultured bacterium]HLD44283.1 conjugal transfer protein TraF [bacterium]